MSVLSDSFLHEVSRRPHAAESYGVGRVQSDSAVLPQTDTPPPPSSPLVIFVLFVAGISHRPWVDREPRFEMVTVAKAVKKQKNKKN